MINIIETLRGIENIFITDGGMETIILRNKTADQIPLEAVFLPGMGMNMISFKKGDVEVIDQSTKPLFEERYAGLGALIGPHFHRRRAACLPKIKDESLFPHIARVKSKGISDPFSHGIARYAPWQAKATEHTVEAVLSGKEEWNGVPISELEGQDFKMNFSASLLPSGLMLELSVVSSSDSVVGIHYYYHLPDGKGRVISQVDRKFLDNGQKKSLPAHWPLSSRQEINLDLDEGFDCTFYPYPEFCKGSITLETSRYTLRTDYQASCQENGWQLYHPQGASYVCIEPVSAQDPRHPNLSVSSLKINLSIF